MGHQSLSPSCSERAVRDVGDTISGTANVAKGGLAAGKVRTCREVNPFDLKVKSKVCLTSSQWTHFKDLNGILCEKVFQPLILDCGSVNKQTAIRDPSEHRP